MKNINMKKSMMTMNKAAMPISQHCSWILVFGSRPRILLVNLFSHGRGQLMDDE